MKICKNRQPLLIFILDLHFYSITYSLTNQTGTMLSCRFATTYHKLAELPPKLCQFCYVGRFAPMISSFGTRLDSCPTRLDGFAK